VHRFRLFGTLHTRDGLAVKQNISAESDKKPCFFAGAYLIVAKKETQDSDISEKDDITNIKSAYQ
jgi:hypothetical protein